MRARRTMRPGSACPPANTFSRLILDPCHATSPYRAEWIGILTPMGMMPPTRTRSGLRRTHILIGTSLNGRLCSCLPCRLFDLTPDAVERLAGGEELPSYQDEGHGERPIEARPPGCPGPHDQPHVPLPFLLQGERPAELPVDAVSRVLPDRPGHQEVQVRIRVQDKCSVWLHEAYREKGGAWRSVKDGVAFLEMLKFGDDPFVTRDLSEAVAGLVCLLADEGSEVLIGVLVPPGGVGVETGSVMTHLHQPGPDLFGGGVDRYGVGGLQHGVGYYHVTWQGLMHLLGGGAPA